MHEDLARRSVNSVKWNAISNVFQIIISFIQTVVLARLLPIETFGIYSGAAAVTTLLGGISNFGLGGAFTYRCSETEDIEQTAAVHFTLQIVINLIWTSLMLAGGFLFIRSKADGYLLAFMVLTLSKTAANFANTPKFMLSRLVQYKRISIINITTVFFTLIFSAILAILNQPLWALMTTNIIGFVADFVLLYLWKPVWKPRLLWIRSTVKYYLDFGSKQVLSRFLSDALDHTDDIWTKTFLGSVPMGFYSKAYSFALYPSKIISDPIGTVAISTFAEIAAVREKLSDAFHRTNAFLIRSGFFLVGILVVIAPEFIRIFIGERWMPMMLTFRLMLPFTLFDPMKKSMANLFVAVGKPEIIVKIRAIQLAVMVVGLFTLGNRWGISGVAAAVDLMMVVGIVLIMQRARTFVDFSLKKFFLFPTVGLVLGMVASFSIEFWFNGVFTDIAAGLIKIIIFAVFYFGVLFLFDFKEIGMVFRMAEKYLFKNLLN
ncbi:MAG: oligosaccharide flippase family protein [Anaerolineaceae bacterium]|nr:oligosaccharide flippase family protein [Anaerolineaceae bacterium]